MIVSGYLASVCFSQSKNSNYEGVGVGGVWHKSINTSDTDMANVYKGRGVFDSEPTTILSSGKIILIDILNEAASSCCNRVQNSIVKIQNSRNIKLAIKINELFLH